jgi:hypothetical protein
VDTGGRQRGAEKVCGVERESARASKSKQTRDCILYLHHDLDGL